LKAGGIIKISMFNVAVATSVDTSIDTGLDGDTYVLGGGGFRQSINEGVANISGTIKAFFENLTLLNKAINGTESSVEMKLTKLTNSLTFLYPEVIYERNSPGIDGPNINNVEYDMTSIITIVVNNNIFGGTVLDGDTILVSEFDDRNILFYTAPSGRESFYFMVMKETHEITLISHDTIVLQNMQLTKIPIATAKKFIGQINV